MSSADGQLFGELYLRSTRPFLTDAMTQADARYVSEQLESLSLEGPVLDAGCGHGRHLTALRTRRAVVGVDLDFMSLSQVARPAAIVQGDFFALPFRDCAFAAAYAWYNSLNTFEDDQHVAILNELARCVMPGGLLLLQGTSPQWAAAQPTARYEGTLSDGSKLTEATVYDAIKGRDSIERALEGPDGRVLAASFFIRYYSLSVIEQMLRDAGFALQFAHGDYAGHAVSAASPDLILGAKRS